MTGFTVTGAELAGAAHFAALIAPALVSSPELGAVRIKADGNKATFAAYDHTTAGSSTLAVQDAEAGTFLVSARLLSLVAATVTKETAVRIETRPDENMAFVAAGRSNWELPLLDLRYYPQLPKPGKLVGRVDGAAFADALTRVLPATSDPKAPPMHGGVALSADLATLTLAATDRWRLSVAETDWEADAELPDTLVVGEVLERMAFAARRETDAPVSLHLAASGMSLIGTTHWVHSPLMASRDPGVWRKISLDHSDATTTATVEVEEFKQVVARASALLDPKDALTLTVGAGIEGHGEVAIGVLDGRRGRVDHGCPAIVDGLDRLIGVDGHYLRQGIATLTTPQARVCLFEGQKKGFILLVPLDEDDLPLPGYRHVIMAKRVLADESAA